MKKNKILLLLLVCSLSACNFGGGNFSWDKYKNNDIAMNLQSAKFQNYKLCSETDDSIQILMDKIESIVENKGKLVDFEKNFNDLNNRYLKIVSSYIIASTKYYANSDRDFGLKADKYYSLCTKIITFEYSIEEKIYHSSNEIKTAYFGDMSDREIEERILGNQDSIVQAQYDEIFQSYQDEGSELYNQVANGEITTAEYLDTGYDYFLRYINKANEFIDKINYDNYLNYTYSYDYGRDYSPTDAMNFVNYVKQYFVPILKEKKTIAYPSTVNKHLLDVLSSYNFCNNDADSADLFKSYAEELGGKYLEAYNNTFKYGYYCFSNDSRSLTTAFQWGLPNSRDSILYFSKNYQNILSVIHEFGHLYSYYSSNGARNNDAYDLLETYSQADEFTFLNYMLNSKKDDPDKDTYQYFADVSLYDNLSAIINEACITEIENYAFTHENLDKATLREAVEDIITSYDGTASNTYFMAPCISSCCYYVSYATSVMEACQFLNMDFEDAKTNYKKLVETPGSLSMVERWSNAGLGSPFEEETFKSLAEDFKKVAEKY